MPMKVSVMSLTGSLIESRPPGHTENTCLYTAGIVAAHKVHHKTCKAAAADGRVLLGVKMCHVLHTTSSDGSASSSIWACDLRPRLPVSCLAPYQGPLSLPLQSLCRFPRLRHDPQHSGRYGGSNQSEDRWLKVVLKHASHVLIIPHHVRNRIWQSSEFPLVFRHARLSQVDPFPSATSPSLGSRPSRASP